MSHATAAANLTATHFATSLLPLTTRLVPVIAEIGRTIVQFRRADLTPQAGYRFETRLQELLRELGRIILEWTLNHLEPHDRKDFPAQRESHGTWYRRRGKTPNRSVATLFGTITVWRMLYQDVHGVEPSIFPLEIRLGLESGRATPALAERAARAAVTLPQDAVLAALRADHGVQFSVATLRAVIAAVATGMEAHRQDAQADRLLSWLEQADRSTGCRKPVRAVGRDGLMMPMRGQACYREAATATVSVYATGMEAHRQDAQADRLLSWLEQADRSTGCRKPVRAVGRDGLMMPMRGQACYREAATATVSVYDRRGRRLGTIYLGRMPEPGQGTLSGQLTTLIETVLRRWTGPMPRLAYITDGGNHQTRYYRRVLRRMSDPHHPGRQLKWQWVIDYYHASEYISQLAEALFADAREGASWARKMGRWLKTKPRGIYRVLHSAAALRRRRIIVSAAKREQYRTAYGYLRKRMRWLDYDRYRRDHLPIGSGVTEAACKTVFTQRMKQSGMTWKGESGQWIADLRVIHLSGVWGEVYQSYLMSKATPEMGTQGTTANRKASKAA